ncbi:MAG: SoxR reducing system RseC family protein [Candidatus Margulisbacteria bacterium]|nr:SoxR reducing system RseC family protein [Candidatus Margulisiibacteriota bacterium]
MKEQGVVVRVISPRLVEVALQKNEACEKCQACHPAAEGMVAIEAVNEIGAQRDDIVEIEIPAGEVVAASFIVYLVPVFFLAGGYLLGAYLTRVLGFDAAQEAVGIVFALAFLACSFLFVAWYDRNVMRRETSRARITGLLKL